jgi:DNA-binding response OmpR family regulator
MYHVLLVEPDDDFCLNFCAVISDACCRVTIVGSSAKAPAALERLDNVDHLVTEAFLPDGSGLVLAEEARRKGKPVHMLCKRRDRIVLYDREGTLFLGIVAMSRRSSPRPFSKPRRAR